MKKTYTARRTQNQWKDIIEQWQKSGQAAKTFCDEKGVGYASFCQWRKRLKESAQQVTTEPDTSFIDLTALNPASTPGAWNIVLSLGNGVELRLNQEQ